MKTMQLLLPDSRGIYIPRDFINNFTEWKGITQRDKENLMLGPDSFDYWETWEYVLQNAFYISPKENKNVLMGKWTLYQDGDLYAVHESHKWNEG